MSSRHTPLRVATGLLLVIGLSGLLVGLQLVVALLGAGTSGTGALIAAGIGAYGALLAFAGVGLFLRRRAAFAVGLVGLAAGLIVLVILSFATALDAIFATGIVIWAVALICLIAGRPATR